VLTAAVVFVLAIAAAAAFTPAVRDAAIRLGAYDQLCSRKVHVRPVPRLGGIAMVAAFVAPVTGAALLDAWIGGLGLASEPMELAAMLLGGAAIAALGVYDDLRGASAKLKLTVQFAVAAGVYGAGFRIGVITHPFGEPIQLGILALPFTMIWIAGVVNAMNLIDGLDGLAGGVAFIAVATLFVVGGLRGDAVAVVVTAALGGAVLGFLLYNFNPASVFMGDSGSMFLGFMLALVGIQPDHAAPSGTVSLLVPILVLGVPIADTLLAMGRRAIRGVPVFSADRAHIHHRLLDRGLSQRQTVLVLYAISVLLGVGAVLLVAGRPRALPFLAVVLAFGIVSLRGLGFFHLAKVRRALATRGRNLEMQAHVRRAGRAMRDARTREDLWIALRFGAWGLGASAVALRLPVKRQDDRLALSHGFDEAPDLLTARFGLDPERPGDTFVELGWNDRQERIDRDTEIAVEMLCRDLEAGLLRLGVRTRRGLFVVPGESRPGSAA
jgi:UDP-GlcNAc:undecaprenyl-phosphate GlcNAc-1-phosphate transferase